MSITHEPEQLKGLEDRILARAHLYYREEEKQMATSSETYVGIDVSKDRLDVVVLGEERGWQVDNTQAGIVRLVEQMQKLQPELIVVEATGGYQRAVVEALFWAGLAVAVVNPARVRQFARAWGCLPRQTSWMPRCWRCSGRRCNPGTIQAKVKQRNS